MSQVKVARRFKVSRETVSTSVRHFREEGAPGLLDRSSRPKRVPHRTLAELRESIERLHQVTKGGLVIPDLARRELLAALIIGSAMGASPCAQRESRPA